MSRINVVDTVLCEVCATLGLAETPLDADGRLTLRFDDTPVTFTYNAEPVEVLWLQVELGEIPPTGRAAPTALLQLNFECWRLNRMTIGLDESGCKAWGFTCVPVAQLSSEMLRGVLQALLEVAMPIRARLSEGDFDLGYASEPSDERPSPPGMLRV